MSGENRIRRAEERIDKEAAEWLVRRDRGLSEREAREFKDWLDRDARHRMRFEFHEQTWERFSTLEEIEEVEEFEAQPVRVGKRGSKPDFKKLSRAILSLAAVLLLGLMVWVGIGLIDGKEQVEYEGRYVVDKYETRILSDGTILELNEGARAKVRLTDSFRRVWMHEGEAHFHVAKDELRPFVVYAGGTEVRAVGTAFNVRVDREGVHVIVTEGRIHFSNRASEEEPGDTALSFSEQLDAGQATSLRLGASNAIPFVETHTYDELTELLAWKPKTLEFSDAPLGDVVTAFNKRNTIQIVLAAEELETMPIEATFRSDNVLAFVRLLELTFDLKADRVAQDEIVLRMP